MCPTPKAEIPSPTNTASTAASDNSNDGASTSSNSNNLYTDPGKSNAKFKYPADWPGPGRIDLNIHDLPHFSSMAEWWYVNAHLDIIGNDGKKKSSKSQKGHKAQGNEGDDKHDGFTLFASFFRNNIGFDEEKQELLYTHYLLWALVDAKNEKYYYVNLLDPNIPGNTLEAIKKDTEGKTIPDERFKQATVEMLEKGVVPFPDRLMNSAPKILGHNMSAVKADAESTANWKAMIEQHDKEKQQKERKRQETKNKKGRRGSLTKLLKSASSSMKKKADAALPRLSLDYDGNTFVKNKDGSYTLSLEDKEVHNIKVQLKFAPTTDAVRLGHDGIIDNDGLLPDFFYYCLPHCTVTGSLTVPDEEKFDVNNAKIERKNFCIVDGEDDETQEVVTRTVQVKGTGWHDHQFGHKREEEEEQQDQDGSSSNSKEKQMFNPSYTWFCVKMDNGYQLCCSEYFIHATQKCDDPPRHFAVLIGPKGQRKQLDTSEFSLKDDMAEKWVSMRTFRGYPTEWEVTIPSAQLTVRVKATFPEQEYVTMTSHPAFWEGRVSATGTWDGNAFTGIGIVERSGFCPQDTQTMEHFFKSVSRETLKSVQKILPFNPTGEKLDELVSHKDNKHFTEYIDSAEYSKALVEPIRAILDRGGKSWRSYAALACCDIVGGNSQKCQDWLALPELMHVGSLIVDDVQDRSTIRRGGPCSHILYGEDVAINAGTMAYFLGQIAIYSGDGDAQQKVDIYNLYFECMRAAHSGQAMDIHGLDYMMPEVVEHGGDLCRQRVIAIHRLKSAVPASSLAAMGCKLGGGSKRQSQGLGAYFEALGIAFQIVDDVLNLKGFTDGLKTKGEDITAGKVTYPVAVAMGRLEKEDRSKLWEIVSSKPEDIETIGEAVALINKVNAIDDSFKEAKEIIEEGWRKLDPVVIDSMVKINLRAFSLYVLDRTY